jgi:PAS domain S-box-containing protein
MKNSEHYFLADGGEMGDIIRSKDWSQTTLGSPESWPQSLRTMVGVMLENPFAMYIAWGSDYTQLYNDAYRPILGAIKHPDALGRSSRDTFAEIWDTIGCMFDEVMQGKSFRFTDMLLPLNRNGFMEDCFFDFSYSPVRLDNGEVGGVLVTVLETTEKKKAVDALTESNARFVNHIMQAPVAMCVLRGEEMVVEIANKHMLELWGKTASEMMDKPIFEGLPEAKNQGLEVLLKDVYTTGEKFMANERPIQLPRNGKIETTYINFVHQALRESDGSISGIISIATDVTFQVMARSKIEESEHKVRAVVENSPFAIAVYSGLDMIIELANDTIINIWGKGKDVIGKPFTEVLPELNNQLVFEQIQNVFKTGKPFHAKSTPLNLEVDGKMGTYYFNYSFTPLYDLQGKIYAVMNTGVDLTDLNLAKKKIEESDKRFRNTVKQAPVGIAIFRGPEHIAEMANESYLKLVDRELNTFIGKPLFESLPETKKVVKPLLDNVLQSGEPYHGYEVPVPLFRQGKESLLYFDFLYYPLREVDGEISGIIVTANDVTEKVEATHKIEQNEQRLNIIVEASELGTWELNLKTRELQYSDRYLEIIGWWDENNLRYQEIVTRVHPDDIAHREKALSDALISGVLHYEVRVLGKDNSVHWVEAKGTVFYDEDQQPEKLLGTARDITALKNHQQELEESEKRFRNLVMHSPIPKAILKGAEMRVELANRTILQKIWKKTSEEVEGKPIFEIFPELEKQKYADLMRQVLNTGKVHSESESAIFIKNDAADINLYIDFEFAPVYDKNKVISGIRMTIIDVTEKVETRKKIEESEKRFRTLTENIPQLIWETDHQGNLLFASGKWYDYTGIHPQGEEDWKAVIHPEDYKHKTEVWERSLQTGEIYKTDIRVKSKDGHYRWHAVIGEPILDKDHQIVKWVGSFTDIEQEKAFTQELENQVANRTKELIQINENLTKSEERYHQMVEEVQDYAILYLSVDGIVENWNIGAEKIKGYKAEEIIGKNFSTFYTQADKKVNLPQRLLRIARESGKAVQEGWRVKKNGTLFWASVVITAVHNKDNEVIGFSKFTHDLTEKKNADDKLKMNALELEQKNLELEIMNKELQSFTYISSHDLQEPLRKIQTFASQIIEREVDNLSDSGRDKFQRIQNAAQRMQALINDLLTYSRTNVQERIFEKTHLSAIVNEVKEDLREEILQKHATVERVDDCEINIIPFQFRQLLYNLLSNSLKFSTPGVPVHIVIESKVVDARELENLPFTKEINYCHISISDNGIGFSPEYNAKIFEVFQRLHGKNEYQGTGIGLAIVKKIVENHNGIITATGQPNKGATFNIYLPMI